MVDLASLNKEIKEVFRQSLKSFWAQFAIVCSILGGLPTITVIIRYIIKPNFLISPESQELLWRGAFFLALPTYFGLFFILLGSVSFYAHLSVKKKIDNLDLDDLKTNKSLFQLESEFYGVKYNLQNIKLSMEEDGACSKKCSFDFESVTEDVNSLEYYARTPTVPESITKNNNACHILQAEERQKGPVRILVKEIKSTPYECRWAIKFVPGLRPGNNIEYNYEQTSPRGTFALTIDDLKRRDLQFDFYSHEIVYPTKLLQTSVYFPLEFNPIDLTYDVWIAGGRVRHDREFIRIREQNFFDYGMTEDKDRVFGKLEIDFPLHGCKYLIRWRPFVEA